MLTKPENKEKIIAICKRNGSESKILIREDEFHLTEKHYDKNGVRTYDHRDIDIRYIGDFGNVDKYFNYMIEVHHFEKVWVN